MIELQEFRTIRPTRMYTRVMGESSRVLMYRKTCLPPAASIFKIREDRLIFGQQIVRAMLVISDDWYEPNSPEQYETFYVLLRDLGIESSAPTLQLVKAA